MESNVCVAVRCRPLSSKERARECESVVNVDNPNHTLAVIPVHSERKEEQLYTFDFTYGDGSTQDQVFQDIGTPLVAKTIDGVNSTLFAYGQTGSGKTYTMMGADTAHAFELRSGDGDDGSEAKVDPDAGVTPRLTIQLFKQVEELKVSTEAAGNKIEVQATLSYLEIYNEIIQDLLNPTQGKSLHIREHPREGIYVEGLCELVVSSAVEVGRLVSQGNSVRKVAATQMNERSSRSHSVLTIKLQQRITSEEGDVVTQSTLGAKMNLVDLAGSERASKTGAEGATLKEGAAINMSLLALGTVINSLSKGQHVNYRDSKLTRLLQESLGGNASTVMLAAISPADYNVDETISTLRYAQRAKKITNTVTRNEDVNQKIIRNLKEEIERLKEQLTKQSAMPVGVGVEAEADFAREKESLQQKLLDLEKEQQDTWEERRREKERLTKELEAERQANVGRALGDIMDSVKSRKVELLEKVKQAQQERATLSKSNRDYKEKLNSDKVLLKKMMAKFASIQKERNSLDPGSERVSELTDTMGELMVKIESTNTAIKQRKDRIKSGASRMNELEELITTLKAELVASSTMLQENDRIRKMIQEEEMKKWEAEKETMLKSERIALHERTKDSLQQAQKQAEEAKETSEMAHRKLDEQDKRMSGIQSELGVVSGRLLLEKRRQTLLKKENENLKGTLEILQLESQQLREEKDEVDSRLNDTTQALRAVEAERDSLQQRNAELEHQLSSVNDAFQAEKATSQELREKLEEAERKGAVAMEASREGEGPNDDGDSESVNSEDSLSLEDDFVSAIQNEGKGSSMVHHSLTRLVKMLHPKNPLSSGAKGMIERCGSEMIEGIEKECEKMEELILRDRSEMRVKIQGRILAAGGELSDEDIEREVESSIHGLVRKRRDERGSLMKQQVSKFEALMRDNIYKFQLHIRNAEVSATELGDFERELQFMVPQALKAPSEADERGFEVFQQMVQLMEQEKAEHEKQVKAEKAAKEHAQQMLSQATGDLINFVRRVQQLEAVLAAHSIALPAFEPG